MSDLFDLIVRMDAIDALYGTKTPYGCTAEEVLRKLPSAEPKKGKWISEGQKNKGFNFWMHCSLCGYKTIDAPSSRTNYCPNCGARMEEDNGK